MDRNVRRTEPSGYSDKIIWQMPTQPDIRRKVPQIIHLLIHWQLRLKDTSDYGQPRVLGNISMGVHIGEVYTDFSQGSFKVTRQSTDMALDGNGFYGIIYQ